jgi:hypothetical protein
MAYTACGCGRPGGCDHYPEDPEYRLPNPVFREKYAGVFRSDEAREIEAKLDELVEEFAVNLNVQPTWWEKYGRAEVKRIAEAAWKLGMEDRRLTATNAELRECR